MPEAPQKPREILGFVRIERNAPQGFRTLKTIKSFWPGETVLQENCLVGAEEDTDEERILAFLASDQKKRERFIEIIMEAEVRDREISVDLSKLQEVLSVIPRSIKEGKIPKDAKLDHNDAVQVISRWRFGASVDRTHVFERGSMLRHSCGAEVEVKVNQQTHQAVVTSRRALEASRFIGIWELQETNLWWKGANIRSAAVFREGVLQQQECGCERCQAEDVCRAIKCPGCLDFKKRREAAKSLMLLCSSALLMAAFVGWRRLSSGNPLTMDQGEVTRNGKLKRWRCSQCDFDVSDTAFDGFLKIETQLVDDLWDITGIPREELMNWSATVEQRVGTSHWLAPHVWFEIYRRQTARNGVLTFSTALVCLRICEWFLSRKLQSPPQAVVDQLEEMMFRTLEFLQASLVGVRDLRVVYLRAVDLIRTFIESVDKKLLDKFKAFAGVAQNIRRRCAFCQKMLRESDMEFAEPKDISADDDGGEPVCCATCQDLWYCDMSCQISDYRRHRHFCYPSGTDFFSKKVEEVLIAA